MPYANSPRLFFGALQVWQSGEVKLSSLATLLSFLLYPSLVLMGIALYKWRDDKWLVGRHYNKQSARLVGG